MRKIHFRFHDEETLTVFELSNFYRMSVSCCLINTTAEDADGEPARLWGWDGERRASFYPGVWDLGREETCASFPKWKHGRGGGKPTAEQLCGVSRKGGSGGASMGWK